MGRMVKRQSRADHTRELGVRFPLWPLVHTFVFFPMNDVPHGFFADAKVVCKRGVRRVTGCLANLSHLSFSQFCFGICCTRWLRRQSESVGMCRVKSRCTVLKILQSIVSLPPVLVIYLKAIGRNSQKGSSDKSMDCLGRTCSISTRQCNCQIAMRREPWPKVPACHLRPHVATTGDPITALVSKHRPPSLKHSVTSPPFVFSTLVVHQPHSVGRQW